MKRIHLCSKDRLIEIANRFSVPLQALGCCILYFIIEMMSRHSFFAAWKYMTGSPLVFLYNAFLIFVTTTIVFLFRRRFLVRFITFFFWFLLGLINAIILANRVTPFTGQDLGLLSDAKKIMSNYVSPVLFVIIIAALAGVVALDVWLWFKGPKYKGKRRWALDIVIIGASIVLFAGTTVLALHKRVLTNYFSNIAMSYENYGFPYCFTVTLVDTGIDQPNGYSEQLVDYIQKEDEEYAETSDSGKNLGLTQKPNIIFVQLESFFDPETVRYLNISEDPIPYYHKLMKEYSSGYLKVPVVGAGTVNTEFEAITGMSLQYFGAGEYPYKTILKSSTCESIPYDLSELGYSTHAIHDNEANFYARRTVYPMLGFDTFTSEEYMPDITDVTETGWVKDHILTSEIMKALKSSSDPDYIYTVSVQGHGDYPTEPTVDDPKITVTGAENREKNNYSWEYYCEQINDMDNFIKELTNTLSNYSEPVVLVMYGDHLPTMGLKESDLDNWNLFETPYVIWNNFGMKKENASLTAYQIGAEVLDRVGIHNGTLVSYHQDRRGTQYYQPDLEILQYDMLYGKKYVYNGESPYKETDLTMGVEPIKVTGLRRLSETSYTVYGENFTASSKVEVNGKLYDDTLYCGQNMLILRNLKEELRFGDRIDVAQQSDSSTKKVLTRTDSQFAGVLENQDVSED